MSTKKFRYLPRWETLETDWDKIISDFKVFPNFQGIKRNPEYFTIDLKINGNVLDYPSFGGGVANNHSSVIEYINKYRREHNVPSIPYVNVFWGTSYHNCGGPGHVYKVSINVWIVDYCETNNIPYTISIDPEVIKPITIESSWKCSIGLHDYEEIKDFVRKTCGFGGWMFPTCIQKCIFRCRKCDTRKMYYKSGYLGGGNTNWHKCSKEKELEIDSYPRL